MASITVSREDLFPDGTTVSAYEIVETRTPTSGAPSGSVVASGTVSGGSVTLTGLSESTGYWLYASSPDRYLRVYIPAAETSGGGGGLFDVVEAGSKTGTYAPAVTAARTLVNLTATGNLTFAPTGWDEGSEILLEFTQDATGSRTLSVDDGSGGRSVTVDGTAGATTSVHIFCRSATDMDIEVPGSGAQGPQGPAGADGADGADGSTWLSGSGAPSNASGADGDYYLRTSNGEVYKKVSGSWADQSFSLVGPTGATGSTGATGAAGADGQTTVTANAQTGDYTLVLGDAGKSIDVTAATTKTVTVPPSSSVAFGLGTVIEVARLGSGAVNIAAGSGVTINSRSSLLGIGNQYGAVSLRKIATDTWLLVGDLA